MQRLVVLQFVLMLTCGSTAYLLLLDQETQDNLNLSGAGPLELNSSFTLNSSSRVNFIYCSFSSPSGQNIRGGGGMIYTINSSDTIYEYNLTFYFDVWMPAGKYLVSGVSFQNLEGEILPINDFNISVQGGNYSNQSYPIIQDYTFDKDLVITPDTGRLNLFVESECPPSFVYYNLVSDEGISISGGGGSMIAEHKTGNQWIVPLQYFFPRCFKNGTYNYTSVLVTDKCLNRGEMLETNFTFGIQNSCPPVTVPMTYDSVVFNPPVITKGATTQLQIKMVSQSEPDYIYHIIQNPDGGMFLGAGFRQAFTQSQSQSNIWETSIDIGTDQYQKTGVYTLTYLSIKNQELEVAEPYTNTVQFILE